MIQRDEIRDKINEFCMENVFNGARRYAGFGTSPLAVVVYLGDKTVHELKAQMKGAFSSLLNIKPIVRAVYINRDNIENVSTLKDSLTEIFSELNELGLLVSGRMTEIHISFVAMMDDPLFTNDCAIEGVRNLKNQLDEIQSLNIVHFGHASFFGVFDQKVGKKNYDYTSAFRFINEGYVEKNGLWNNVYHLQKLIYQNSYETVARTIAMKIIRDSIYQDRRQSSKSPDPGDYCWNYIGMDEMKLPELLICNILITAYGSQLVDRPLSMQDRQTFKNCLEYAILGHIKESCEILQKSDWIRYLPRIVQRSGSSERSGFFSKKTREAYEYINFSEMLVDKDMVDVILTECTEGIVDELNDPDCLFSVIRSAFSVLAHSDTNVPRLRVALMDTIRELTKNFEKRAAGIILEGSPESEEGYFEELFKHYVDKEILDIAVQVLKSCADNSVFENSVSSLLNSMNEDSARTKQVLEELRVNCYGGADALKLPELVHDLQISIDTPVEDACKVIDQITLDTLVNDDAILRDNAAAFLTRVQRSSTMRNSIGQVSGKNIMSPLEYEIFVAKPIGDTGMQVWVNDLFRANTMQVLSYSEWSSMKNLSAYYKEV